MAVSDHIRMTSGIRVERFLMVKLGCAAVVAVGTLLVCQRFLSAVAANGIVRSAGYWIVLLNSTLLVGFLVRRLSSISLTSWRAILRKHAVGLAAIGVLGTIWHLHEPHRLKTLYDEAAYSGIAYNMHMQREATYPARAHWIDGRLQVMDSVTDKRPFFFPFLISVIHDLTGYRLENVYWLNAALGYALLGIIYLLAAACWQRWAGVMAVALIGGLPLAAQSVTSGGYEILNLVLVVLAAYCALRYLKSSGTRGLDLLIVVALLLAQVRYESILFVLAIPLVVALKATLKKVVRITWFSAVAPAFLALPILVHRVFMAIPGYQQTEPGQAFFALAYLPDNLASAVFYLFDPAFSNTNSALLSLGGVVSVLLLAVRSIRQVGRIDLRKSASSIVLILFGGVVAANTLIALSHFWGNWDDPLVSRFSLPLQCLFAFGIVAAVATIRMGNWTRSVLTAAVAAHAFAFGIPPQAQAAATSQIATSLELIWLEHQLQGLEKSRTLLITDSPIAPILRGYPAITFRSAGAKLWAIQYLLDHRYYDNVFVVQRFYANVAGTDLRVASPFVLDGVQTEVVAELRPRMNVVTRLNRITAVAPEHAAVPDAVQHMLTAVTSEIDEARRFVELFP